MNRFAGRYVLLRPLGEGGMGVVHLALDLSSGTQCALKRLKPGATRLAPDSLRREFELLARVHHPSVVSVLELGFASDGTAFYTMEYVPGQPAHRALPRGHCAALCSVIAQATHGLEALHAAGVVHGDVKPSNLMVVGDPGLGAAHLDVRLLDFGLAALLDGDRVGHRGTPGYAAPEVVRGEMPGVAADLYGLGATLYALAAGKPAFASHASTSRLSRQQNEPPPAVPLEEAGLPGPLIRLILRLMAPGPAERPRELREVRHEIERIEPGARRLLSERLRTERVVGREPELARLERRLERDVEGPGVCFVSGDAGLGKSALLRELLMRATLAGHRVFPIDCGVAGRAEPVALTLWRRLAAEARAEAMDSAPSRRAVELLEQRSGGWSEADLGSLVDAAVSWGRAIRAQGATPVVLLDDCERLDPLSRKLAWRTSLHPESSLRWVWAGRGAGLDEDQRALMDPRAVDRLALGALDRAAIERLASARLHAVPPREVCDFLWERAGGHPGLVVELLFEAARHGGIREGEERLVVDAEALARIAPTVDFEATRQARLAELSSEVRACAVALAVWDRPAGLERVRLLVPGATAAHLDELVTRGLVVCDSGAAYSLCPPGLGRKLLGSADPALRARLHREALADPALTAAERFHHLRGCGEAREALAAAEAALAAGRDVTMLREAAALAELEAPAEAATWLERTARALMDEGRYTAAISPLERSLALEPGGEHRFRRWQFLVTSRLRAGNPAEAEAAIVQALAESPPAPHRAMLMSSRASCMMSLSRLEDAETLARESLALAEAAGDQEALGTAAMTLGGVCVTRGRPEEGDALAVRAEAAFQQAGHALGALRALGLRAGAAAAARDIVKARDLYRRAQLSAQQLGLRLAGEELLMNEAVVLTEAGCWAEAGGAFTEALRIALEEGRPRSAALAMTNLALNDALSGNPNRALRRGRAALRLSRQYLPRLEASAWRALAMAYRISGRLRRAERAQRRGMALALRGGQAEELRWSQVEYAQQCIARGRWDEAGETALRALATADADRSVAATLLAVVAARAAIRRRDFDGAAARAEECARRLEGRSAPFAQAHLTLLRAETALAQGRTPSGAELAGQAFAALAQLPAPADRGAAALECARVAFAAGADTAAPVGTWLHDAAGAFERFGDRESRSRALALLVEWFNHTRVPVPSAVRDRDLLESVGRLIDSLSDLQVLAQRAMHMAVEHLGAERGVLLLTDPKTGQLVPTAEHGAMDATARSKALTYSRKVVERVARSGGSLLISDAPSDPHMRSESIVGLGLRSIVCVPLHGGGRVVGAVYLDDSRRPDTFSREDRALLEGFAHLMAAAIEKSRGHEEVQRANEMLVGENVSLRREVAQRFQLQNFICTSAAMQRVLAVVERAAQTTSTVLVTGENGTGKEMIARILHHSGKRARGPFVAVNCGAIPETLLETELFGILPSVATGVRGREGRFVQAHGGTLFLDEIGDMPLPQQVALLSVIANREITPVGGGRPISVDVRIIAATNRDLRRLVDEGAFREDLYYRLNVIPIEVPPLRERKADIPAMARHFANLFAQQQERSVPEVTPEFMAALMRSDWSGNVRELQNYIERIVAMTPGNRLLARPLPPDLEARMVRSRSAGKHLPAAVGEIEQRMILESLERHGGNQTLAARELGLTEQSLRYRLRKYALPRIRQNQRIRRKRR